MQTGKCNCHGAIHLECREESLEKYLEESCGGGNAETDGQMMDSLKDVCLKAFAGGKICLPVLKG